jgi:surface polysaccharide O-acyltransferase-like enzyme
LVLDYFNLSKKYIAKNLGIYIFYVKIVSVIMTTKITNSKREIETDFLMVTLAFKNAFMVLQKLRNHSFKSVHFN